MAAHAHLVVEAPPKVSEPIEAEEEKVKLPGSASCRAALVPASLLSSMQYQVRDRSISLASVWGDSGRDDDHDGAFS